PQNTKRSVVKCKRVIKRKTLKYLLDDLNNENEELEISDIDDYDDGIHDNDSSYDDNSCNDDKSDDICDDDVHNKSDNE
ncbi:2643_t:CDS:2, partial [Funneliformis geosporum]